MKTNGKQLNLTAEEVTILNVAIYNLICKFERQLPKFRKIEKQKKYCEWAEMQLPILEALNKQLSNL